MIARFLIAAIAVAALPLSVAAAEKSSGKSGSSEKKICKVERDTGSRLGGVKRCRTRAEMEALKDETRNQIDRVQALKTHTGG
jgi:Spy/CpxP family protein refolding chaperone